jgi:hypothetical protein
LASALLLNSKNTSSSNKERQFGVPVYLVGDRKYFYRIICTVTKRVGEDLFIETSNPSKEISLYASPPISEPMNLEVNIANVGVKPLQAVISWSPRQDFAIPDRWQIYRKVDSDNDSFTYIGSAYLENIFLDKNVEPETPYIYRVRGVDSLGKVTDFKEVRISL